jgi:hypothetical protein
MRYCLFMDHSVVASSGTGTGLVAVGVFEAACRSSHYPHDGLKLMG